MTHEVTYNETRVTFAQAKDYCRQNGGYIPSIKNDYALEYLDKVRLRLDPWGLHLRKHELFLRHETHKISQGIAIPKT